MIGNKLLVPAYPVSGILYRSTLNCNIGTSKRGNAVFR